jgi:hypothetical protein
MIARAAGRSRQPAAFRRRVAEWIAARGGEVSDEDLMQVLAAMLTSRRWKRAPRRLTFAGESQRQGRGPQARDRDRARAPAPPKKKRVDEMSGVSGFSSKRLQLARAVLVYSRPLALAVRDGTRKLDEAMAEVEAERKRLDTDEAKLARLRGERA